MAGGGTIVGPAPHTKTTWRAAFLIRSRTYQNVNATARAAAWRAGLLARIARDRERQAHAA